MTINFSNKKKKIFSDTKQTKIFHQHKKSYQFLSKNIDILYMNYT